MPDIKVQAKVLCNFRHKGIVYHTGQLLDAAVFEPMDRIGLDRQGKIRLEMSPPNFKPTLQRRAPHDKSWSFRDSALPPHRRGT
jgi:hypothetical protein